MLDASVVIPTYKRPDLLCRCLEALFKQDYPAERFDIWVVDDAADPATLELLMELVARRRLPALNYITASHRRGPAAARNLGWRAACAPVIAFTDDDCVPDPGWLSAGLAGPAAEFVTANCFCRRAALALVGGFDERFSMAWREDSDLQFQFIQRGLPVGRAEEAVVVHPVRAVPWGFSLGQQRKSMYNALLYKKHPELYRRRIQGGPPWAYYATAALGLLALITALLGWWIAFSLAFSTWLAFTLEFCLRRLQGTSHRWGHIAEMALTSALIPYLSIYWRLAGAVKYRTLFL